MTRCSLPLNGLSSTRFPSKLWPAAPPCSNTSRDPVQLGSLVPNHLPGLSPWRVHATSPGTVRHRSQRKKCSLTNRGRRILAWPARRKYLRPLAARLRSLCRSCRSLRMPSVKAMQTRGRMQEQCHQMKENMNSTNCILCEHSNLTRLAICKAGAATSLEHVRHQRLDCVAIHVLSVVFLRE